MKKRMIFAISMLCIFLLIGCGNKYEVDTLYDENGTIHYEGELKNGEPHGYGKAFNEYGILFYEGNFKDGSADQNGYTKTYYDNGNLMFDGILENGVRIEGYVYEDNGNYKGYIDYPEISIIGEWSGMQVGYDEMYEFVFKEDGSFEYYITNNVKGKYEILNDTEITLTFSNKEYLVGSVKFVNRNNLLMTMDNGEAFLLHRKGTDGYRD